VAAFRIKASVSPRNSRSTLPTPLTTTIEVVSVIELMATAGRTSSGGTTSVRTTL